MLISPSGETTAAFLWDDVAGEPRPSTAFPDAGEVPFPTEDYRACECCPKKCGFDRTRKAHPTCGDLELRVASHGLAFGDEAEISGTRGSGAIMLSGCPLRCPSCHSLEMVEDGAEVTIGELLAICAELEGDGAHNVQILSPTCHLPALRVALRELRRSGFPLPIVWKSSGYESIEELRKLEGLVDVYFPDLKFGSCSAWAKKAGAKNYGKVACAAIGEMIRQAGPLVLDANGTATRGVMIRHVRAPLPAEETREIETFLAGLPAGVRISYLDRFMLLDEFSLAQEKANRK